MNIRVILTELSSFIHDKVNDNKYLPKIEIAKAFYFAIANGKFKPNKNDLIDATEFHSWVIDICEKFRTGDESEIVECRENYFGMRPELNGYIPQIHDLTMITEEQQVFVDDVGDMIEDTVGLYLDDYTAIFYGNILSSMLVFINYKTMFCINVWIKGGLRDKVNSFEEIYARTNFGTLCIQVEKLEDEQAMVTLVSPSFAMPTKQVLIAIGANGLPILEIDQQSVGADLIQSLDMIQEAINNWGNARIIPCEVDQLKLFANVN